MKVKFELVYNNEVIKTSSTYSGVEKFGSSIMVLSHEVIIQLTAIDNQDGGTSIEIAKYDANKGQFIRTC
jgi:hypothetical protein